MLVASGVEFGDACTAAAGQLPQVIGYIQTAIGGGNIKRPSGIAVQVMAGDSVCRGDVIETTADGRIEIRFVDGTVFNLSRDARVVLSEFARDSNGTLRSALFAVTRGTFAFIASQLAMGGSLTVDTPVGSIRSRAQGCGIGILSLAALTFSTMKVVQAADSNVTFLDDDKITYKDLEHGVFELITKEAIPRHIIVEDPGETVVLRRSGSSVSVNEVANSLTRMQELQAAQQDVLANYAKGIGTTGSSTPPFVNPLPVEPINFIQTDALHGQNALLPIEAMIFTVPEIIIVRPPPILNTPTGPTEIDTVVFDRFTATSGTFSASTINGGAKLTFSISGGTAGNTVLGGVTYDVSNTGPFGTLYVDSTTGAYTFVPNGGAINALQAPTTESFTITVSDGSLSASRAFTININGVNDAAIVSGITAGTAVEAGGVSNATAGTPTAVGTLTDTDVDNPPNTFTAVSSPTASAGGYGSFTMTAAGVWTYTINETNSVVQALNVGDTLTDTFTVTTIDGTLQVVTITINGSNDSAIISGATTGSVIETGAAMPGTLTTSGTLTDTDVDNAPNTFTAVSPPTVSAVGYGLFTITAAGIWTYTLNDANAAVQALNVGDTLTDSFTVTTVDGTPKVVTITINGSNDAAIISGTTTGSVIEAGGVANATLGTPIASGTLTDTDVDNAANSFTAVSSPTVSAGGYGVFTMTAAGVWTYTLNDANAAVQALNVGDTLTDSFTVTTTDGTPQVIAITINGSNDAAIISGTATGAVIEAGGISPGVPIASGTLTDIDIDNAPNSFTAVGSPTLSDGGYGLFTMTAAGVWTYTLDNANTVVDALDVGDTLTDSFTVHTVDGTAMEVTITIHGSSDADPNDFDNLATGTTVISDPPYVFGTPGDDSIAGGGDVSQIIYGGAGDDTLNGTGVNDIIYGGSGNDTIKGNNGDDTIYGGSGSDTINGSNGNDTIIGGFGADHLTGGNGDDRFVYLSVADSHAGRFDTITDFTSGSDKIDLTAMGALAFLALTPTSTSVPAHTIAWLYDSAANETIVYVNPTDQTLTIGSSDLLEIHLQGVATVEASDFIIESTTASAAVSGEPINLDLTATVESDGAVIATAIAGDPSGGIVDEDLRTNGVGDSFDTGQHWFGLLGHAGFSFDEVQSHSTENSNGDVVITLANGQSTGPNYADVTPSPENSVAFSQTPVLQLAEHGAARGDDGWIAGFRSHWNSNSALSSVDIWKNDDHTFPKGGQLDNGELVPTNAGLIKAAGTHGHTIDAGPNDLNTAGPEASEGHGPMIASSIGGSRASPTDAGAAGTRGLGDSFKFKDELPGHKGSDVIDRGPEDHSPTWISDHENSAGQHGLLEISETQTLDLSSPWQHSTNHFSIVPHQAGGVVVTHVPHDLIV
jgi:VCBS repeat-containing protein